MEATATIGGRMKGFVNNRWLVFVVSMWVECCAGFGYMFGSISPIIKSSMGYNQKQIGLLGVAKNLGECIGYIAGCLSEILPFWALLAIGAVQNFVGFGVLWLIITNKLPNMPLWVLCVFIFMGHNGESYYNTAALVSCVQNFPKSRGPIVGILKGFCGLSGAILSQLYHLFSSTNGVSLILMIAVGPPATVLSLMFIIRYVEGHRQTRPSDSLCFTFVYGVCLLLAAYIMGFLLLDHLVDMSHSYIIVCSVILLVLLLLPLTIPVTLAFVTSGPSTSHVEENLLPKADEKPEVIFSEVDSDIQSEDERSQEGNQVDRRKRISQLQSRLVHAAAEGAVLIKRSRRGPRRGENFTLQQALVKADFWLVFVSLVLATGSGATIIDNLGQMCQSLGYSDARNFVSIISVWNFLGRVGGGYFSELVVRKYSYPRPVAMAFIQVVMAIGLLYYAVAAPGAIYVTTMLVGFGYGAQWGIAPAAVSELFGLKSFGAFYNFLTLAMPTGSFIFSSILASNIYDYYAEKQGGNIHDSGPLTCMGTICYSVTCAILSVVLLVAAALSLILVRRTKSVYANLYGQPS